MIDVAVLVAVVVALTELVKRADFPTKYLPMFSLALGILVGVIYLDGSLQDTVLYGAIIGLSASGLFDHTKVFTKKGAK